MTPGSSWGVLAHTQLDNVAVVQLAATGIGGLTFLMALGSSLTAAAWSTGVKAIRADLLLFASLLASTLLFGQLVWGVRRRGQLSASAA